MLFGKNKKKLSYSAIDCWLKNKNEYRNRYYRLAPFVTTPELTFGKQIADKLEAKDPSLDHVKQYSDPEHEIKLTIDGVPVIGYIDSYCPDTRRILEFKTGRVPWTQKRVDKHLQLDIYSLAIELMYGEVDDHVELIWLETEKINEKTTGLIPVSSAYEIALTGKVKTFHRDVTKEDRLAMRRLLVAVANEIAEDYADFSKNPTNSSSRS